MIIWLPVRIVGNCTFVIARGGIVHPIENQGVHSGNPPQPGRMESRECAAGITGRRTFQMPKRLLRP
jgi:hypothetical protein